MKQTIEDEPFSYLDDLRHDDTDNAKRLLAVADGRLRYVHKWGKFIVYGDDGVWHIDYKDARTMEMAKAVSEQLYEDASRAQADLDDLVKRDAIGEKEAKSLQAGIDQLTGWAKYSAMRSGRANMVHLARGVDGLLIEHETLETDPYLFNTTNGTWDFKPVKDDPENGRPIFRDHDPEDLLLLKSPARWEPDAQCPLWERCLEQWQPDPEMRDYLQMRAGACALGVATPTLDVDIGGGGNGKSKFHGAIKHVLGDYAIVPHKSLLMSQRFGEHDTVYADLFRKRGAFATETKAGESLDEESVKQLTGGDRQKGRRMREDYWEFWPTHTLILYTNHRPRIKGTDEGIWRRVHLVEWNAYFPPGGEGTDEDLLDRLLDEAPGILRWVLNGVLMFLREGWFVPESVEVATEDYREGEDLLGKFLRDCVSFTKDLTDLEDDYDPDEDWEYFSTIHQAADEWRRVEGLQYNFSARNLAEGLAKGGATKGRRVRHPMTSTQETVWNGLRLL